MEGMKYLYREKISDSHIKEPALKELLSFLLNKYGLTDDEVAEQHKTVPFQKRKCYYEITRRQSEKNGDIHISFSAEISSISVTATLIST